MQGPPFALGPATTSGSPMEVDTSSFTQAPGQQSWKSAALEKKSGDQGKP